MDVQGGTYSGGLAGSNGLVIVACSVTGVVGGGGDVGGLVGNNFSGTVIASYSAASVADGSDTGGLVGSNFSGTIIASYSIGSVSDYNGVGGFVEVGGLVGSNFADRGTARDSYWDTQTSASPRALVAKAGRQANCSRQRATLASTRTGTWTWMRMELVTTSGISATQVSTQRLGMALSLWYSAGQPLVRSVCF